MTKLTAEAKFLLEQHARDWDHLSKIQERTEPGRARAYTYKRTARSLRLEKRKGIPHCACCLQPMPCTARDWEKAR